MNRRLMSLVALGLFSCGDVRKESAATTSAPDPNNPEAALEMGDVQRMSWLGVGRASMDAQLRDRHCRSPHELRSLQYGESLWVACEPGEIFYGGVLTRLDPKKKEAQSFWQFPQMLSLGSFVGIAPLPDEQLAILYSIGGMQSKPSFALAITGPEGWALPPMEIGSPGELLGFAWNKGAVELVVTDSKEITALNPADTAPPTQPTISIISYTTTGQRRERSMSVSCKYEVTPRCAIEGAYLRTTETTWRLLVDAHEAGGKLTEQREDGNIETSNLPTGGFRTESDLSVSGLLNRSSFGIKQTLLGTGLVAPHPEAPRGVEREASEAHDGRYRVQDGRLSTYCIWEMVGNRASLQSVNGRLLYTDLIKKTGMLAITDATNPSQPKEKQVGPIAGKVFRWRCTDLAAGSFVAKKDGGYWLIGENGCYVDLPGVW